MTVNSAEQLKNWRKSLMAEQLDGTLSQINRDFGFKLNESDDHIVELVLGGHAVARFGPAATAEEINKAADQVRLYG